MNKQPEKYTLAQAIEKERTETPKELPVLYAPGLGLDQAPTTTPCVGTPVPEDAFIQQPPHPEQKQLVHKAIERCPTKAEHQVFEGIWADIRSAREAVEADREWGFVESPELIAQQQPLPEGVYWLDEIVKEPWCRRLYKTKKGLIKFLLIPHEYPPRRIALGLITRRGFDKLVARKLKIRHEKDLERKERAALKQAADQGPEPIDSHKQPESNQPFKTSPKEITRGK